MGANGKKTGKTILLAAVSAVMTILGCMGSYAAVNSRYEVYYQRGSWDEALKACQDAGGHLACIQSREELDYIIDGLEKGDCRGQRFYIGAKRETRDSEYYWITDSQRSPENALNASGAWCRNVWMNGEPTFRDASVNADETVVEMFYYEGEGRWVWNDVPNHLENYVPSSTKMGYICEYDQAGNAGTNPGQGAESYGQMERVEGYPYEQMEKAEENSYGNVSVAEAEWENGLEWDLDQMPEDFYFASGVGAWSTELQLSDDWSFVGEYHDSNVDSVYICEFSGQFSQPEQIDDYTYSMWLLSLEQDGGAEGEEYYENGMRYIYSDPYGITGGNEFRIYLPGAPLDSLPEEFISWTHITPGKRDTLPGGYYGLYNVNMGEGFVAVSDEGFWYDAVYDYSHNGKAVRFSPSIYGSQTIEFMESYNTYPCTFCVDFSWPTDEATEFRGTFRDTGAGCTIRIGISDDYETMTLFLRSDYARDLTRWGGTNDGLLTAVFHRSEKEA